MKQHILEILSDALPGVDFNAPFLLDEIDSVAVATILVVLEAEYKIPLGINDATPKNLSSLDAIVRMVEKKLEQ